MDKSTLVLTPGLTPALGYAVMIGLAFFLEPRPKNPGPLS